MIKSEQFERAWQMMRAYLADSAREKDERWNLQTEELNAVIIRVCAERLSVDRHADWSLNDSGLELDAVDHAIRYIAEHLDVNGKCVDAASGLILARRFQVSTALRRYASTIRCRLRRTRELLRDGAAWLADIALEVQRGYQSCLARVSGQKPRITPLRHSSTRSAPARRHSALKTCADRHRW